jgi:hypothetical protein
LNCATPVRLDRDTGSRVGDNRPDLVVREPLGGSLQDLDSGEWHSKLTFGDLPRGREHIVIGEWGPLDPRLPALVPFGTSGEAAATFRVVGSGLPFRVTPSDGFVAEPAAGTAPAVVRLKPRSAPASSVTPWRATVRIGDRDFTANGTLLSAKWNVRWWEWQTDPREDSAALAALFLTHPLDVSETDTLAFDWRGAAPTPKVPADHFATVAETTLTLPAGCYRITTISDDGIRVFLDGEPVLEDWTWHAPKEIAVERTLTAGSHTIRIEHFELDGHAALHCSIEPLPPR